MNDAHFTITIVIVLLLIASVFIALVLSLPANLRDRIQLVAMDFGAVTFSLLVQALTISKVLKVLKIGAHTGAVS